jgi:thioesterase domain-containing protein
LITGRRPFSSASSGVSDREDCGLRPDSRPDIAQAVRFAWDATFPLICFQIDKPWIDLGIDSLKALEFVVRLERLLGRRVSFDALTSECTALDLIRYLDGEEAEPLKRPRTVFLVPGILGDEPKLATFRKTLSDDVKFETLLLPDIDTSTRILSNISATAALLVDRVVELQHEPNIVLAGFSFGGLVAQEMASQLEARGHRVCFLAILDPPTNQGNLTTSALSVALEDIRKIASALRGEKAPTEPSLPTIGGFRAAIDRLVFAVFMRVGLWEAARRLIVKAAQRNDLMWVSRRRKRFLYMVRGWAMLRWQPLASRAATMLLANDNNSSSIGIWRSMCPGIQLTQVHVEHGQIFEPEMLPFVREAFLRGLATIDDDLAVA